MVAKRVGVEAFDVSVRTMSGRISGEDRVVEDQRKVWTTVFSVVVNMKGRTSGEVKVTTTVVLVGTRDRPPVRLDTVCR